jgi:hypothetical protein
MPADAMAVMTTPAEFGHFRFASFLSASRQMTRA